MKLRKIICLLIAIIFLNTLMPLSVSASDAEVDSADEFLSAIENRVKNIKVTGSFTLARQKSGLSQTATQDNDFIPLIIPANTRIYGTDPDAQVIGFRFPIQLAGNAVIENVGLSFTNTAEYQRTVFMGGYELTLNNIKTEGAYDFSIYAGSFDFLNDAPATGNAANLIIDAPNSGTFTSPNPNINNIYLSSVEPETVATFKAYDGTAAMTISQKTKISKVYANGAAVTVNGSGLQASTINYVTDSDTVLTLESGVTQCLSGGEYKEIVLPSGSYLELTEIETGSEINIAKLTGGGTVIRDNSGRVSVQSYSGNTVIRCDLPSDGAELLMSGQDPDENNNFILDSINQNAGFELEYENGCFFLSEKNVSGVAENIPYIDADGTEKICPSADLIADSSSFVYLGSDDGNDYWYTVNGNVTVDGMMGIGSNVHLILEDGCSLTVKGGTVLDYESGLTVYGQSRGTGVLRSTEIDGYGAGIGSWDISYITINGGIIYAEGSFGTSGMGGTDCDVTVNGGTVYASSGSTDGQSSGAGIGGGYEESSGTFTVNGGFVSAKSYRGEGYHIQDHTYKTSPNTNGIVFEDTVGKVYGDVILRTDAEIKDGQVLTVDEGQILTVAEGVTLTNSGAVINNGTINVYGNITAEDCGYISMSSPSAKIVFFGDCKISGTGTDGENHLTDGTVEIKGDVNVNANTSVTSALTVILSGTSVQNITGGNYRNLIIENSSADGVTISGKITVTRLFNHNSNNFTVCDDGVNSEFADFDGDGLKDNADPYPLIGNDEGTERVPRILIRNLNGSNEQRVDWWKSYSSQTMNLSVRKYNCERAAYYKWTSSSKKVSVDSNNVVRNTGYFSRSAVLILTAYDNAGTAIAEGRIKVRFYKFEWQRERIATQSMAGNNYISRDMTEQKLSIAEENKVYSAVLHLYEYIEKIFANLYSISAA